MIHIEVSHDSDEIRIRALLGEAAEEDATSLDDADLYNRVLRGAFKLGPAPEKREEAEAAATD